MTFVIESTEVILAAHDPNSLWGFYIDAPRTRRGLPAPVVEIVGWVLGCVSPAVKVLVKREGTILGHDQVHRHRRDVSAAYPQVPGSLRSGFRVTVDTALVLDAEIEVQALLANGNEVLLGTIGVERHADRPRYLVELARNQMTDDQRTRWGRRFRRLVRPVRLGTLHRTTPLSHVWGFDRGTPVDRYYIAQFFEEHRTDIRGRVLEVKDAAYTEQYGTEIDDYDVVDIDAGNPDVTIVTDLTTATAIPSDSYDCFVMTQTLQVIYDFRSAIREAHRILRPGGVLLLTVPALGKLAQYPSDHWRFTPAACSMLFESVFGAGRVEVRSYGNVLTGIASLTGIACEELSDRELRVRDDLFPMLVTVRAVKGQRRTTLGHPDVNAALLPDAPIPETDRPEPKFDLAGIESGSACQDAKHIGVILRGLAAPDSRVLLVGGGEEAARALREQGYHLTTVASLDGAPLEVRSKLGRIIRTGISTDGPISETADDRFDLIVVPDFPGNLESASGLVDVLRTLLVPEGCVVVLASLANSSSSGKGWTPESLGKLLESKAFALARIEQGAIDLDDGTSSSDVQAELTSLERVLAVAYPLTDHELISMWHGLRELAADSRDVETRMKDEIALRDVRVTQLEEEIRNKTAELEIVYGSKTWRLATLYWKARQKLS